MSPLSVCLLSWRRSRNCSKHAIQRILVGGFLLLWFGVATAVCATEPEDWTLGPFTRPADTQPVIKPDPSAVFDCPMRGSPVHWEATHTFNPAAVVRDGMVYVLYRAEDDQGHEYAGYTSRLGLAWSDDGIHFSRRETPVLFPDDDCQKSREWEGGCEDPRLVEMEDGTYAVFYTQYHRHPGDPWMVTVGVATSPDLVHWTKIGPVVAALPDGGTFMPRKSASLVTEIRDGRLVATRINGRYWLYVGEHTIDLLSSEDLRTWTLVRRQVLQPEAGTFDSGLVECGPPAVLTSKGIVLLYNGKNASHDTRDPSLKPETYSAGQVLFDASDPSRVLGRTAKPFLKPELPWEASGQYVAGTTFIEGLVRFHDRWFLYYGSADSFVGVAISSP